MAHFPTFLLLAALLCVHSSYGRSLQEPLHEIGEEQFNRLALVLTWPRSFCQKMCVRPNPNHNVWTIHGLWPFISGVHAKHVPVYCQGRYDARLIHGTLRDEMNQKWPNLRGEPNDKFWKHEFEKHGMCPFDASVFRPQEEYFQHAVDLYDEYDIKTILQNGGVVPSLTDVYTLTEITTALHNGLGVHPAVYCFEVKGTQYLLEVRMCFDLNYRPISCGDSLVGGGRCNPKKSIIYSPTDIKVTHDFSGTHHDDDLAFQFLLDIAKMGEKEMMMDEEEEDVDDDGGLWENDRKNENDKKDKNDGGLDVDEHKICLSSKRTKKLW